MLNNEEIKEMKIYMIEMRLKEIEFQLYELGWHLAYGQILNREEDTYHFTHLLSDDMTFSLDMEDGITTCNVVIEYNYQRSYWDLCAYGLPVPKGWIAAEASYIPYEHLKWFIEFMGLVVERYKLAKEE